MIVQRHDAPRGFTAGDNIFTGENTFSGITTFTSDVGIGTTSPQELLHVGAGTDASDITATDLLVTRAGPSNLSVRDSTNGVEIFLFASSVGGVMGTVTNDPLNILTNNTSAIFIDASQNVDMSAALTAASYGGITEANLVDKAAAEAVSGAWTFSALVTANAGINMADTFLAVATYVNIAAGTTTGGVRIFEDDEVTIRGYVYFDGGSFGLLNNAGAWAIKIPHGTTDVTVVGALKVQGNCGFYNTTPIAKQTGVAVSAAGVHAALVNLGLIT